MNGVGRKRIHAPISLDSISSVLEVATGSGIWLEEVAKLVPDTAKLIGIDISAKLFPRLPPPNVRFLQASVLGLPKEWTNKFDLVNQRLLLIGIRSEEWHTIFSEIFRVLKPGGWFQLYEIDEWEGGGPAQEKFRELMTLLLESKGAYGVFPCGASKWQQNVKDAGFEDVRVTWHGWPIGEWAGEEGLLGRWNYLEFLKGCKIPIINAGGFGVVSGEKEFDECLTEVGRELYKWDGTRMRSIMICAQKPL